MLFVCFSCTEWGSGFLNRHAEGLQQLQQLLPEEINAADGTKAHAQELNFIFLVFGRCFDQI